MGSFLMELAVDFDLSDAVPVLVSSSRVPLESARARKEFELLVGAIKCYSIN